MKKRLFTTLFLFCIAFSFGQEINSVTEVTIGDADVPYAVIENVPVYPGCEGDDNITLKKCMSQKITKHVKENFNIKKAVKKYSLTPGKKRISVQFKIDKKGFVTNVIARAPHPFLKEEAIRVISSLPQMKPGKQRGKNVGVLYSLPILFEVEKPKRLKKKKN